MKFYINLIFFLILQSNWLNAQEIWNLVWTKNHVGDQVYSASFNHDGSRVVSVSNDWQVRVWNSETGLIEWFGTHVAIANHALYSPDGSKVVSCGDDMAVIMWNSENGSTIWQGYHTNSVKSVRFSVDGSKVISGSYDNTVKMWDAETGGLYWMSSDLGNDVIAISISNDATTIAAGLSNGMVYILNGLTGRVNWSYQHQGSVTDLAFSPDGTKLVSGSKDNTFIVASVHTATPLWTGNHSADVNSICFSPDGSIIVSASSDGALKTWNSTDGSIIWTGHHAGIIWEAKYSNDGNKIVTGSNDKTIKIWNSNSGELLWTSISPQVEALSVNFSNDDRKLVSGSGKYAVSVWGIQTTGVGEDRIPAVFNLEQNFPNPFNPETVISYQLAIGSFIILKIYDAIGKEIKTLVNEFKPAGRYNYKFSILNSQFSSGVYFYKLIAGNFSQTKKMVLLR
ncbi:MAG: PQQ-binding-like beta-propeller repeat protein [Melioribacteraceae bacterium]|nr:PQQ-binding-like beta-propeller repeat protein [Melioribacteraceae bacterium]